VNGGETVGADVVGQLLEFPDACQVCRTHDLDLEKLEKHHVHFFPLDNQRLGQLLCSDLCDIVACAGKKKKIFI